MRTAALTLDGAIKAWQHFHARTLTSTLVCRTLFGRWGLCACGQCLHDHPEAPDD